jgi:transcriptional regulator with XRE-family HTH domain
VGKYNSQLQVSDRIEDLRGICVFIDILVEYTYGRGLRTHKQIATLLNVSEALVSYWLSGSRLPSPEMLLHIARRLSLTTGERENLLFAFGLQRLIDDLVDYMEVAVEQDCGISEAPVVDEILAKVMGASNVEDCYDVNDVNT